MEEATLTPAERMYKRHKENVLAYQKKFPERVKEKNRNYLAKVRGDPEAFEEFKRKRREYEKAWRAKKSQEKKAAEPEPEPEPEPPNKEDVATLRRIENEKLRAVVVDEAKPPIRARRGAAH